MPTVVVRHDLPIAASLEGRRADLVVKPADTTAETRELLSDADALVINPSSWDDGLLDALDEGDWVQTTSTGYSAYPLDAFEERKVTLTNATGNYGSPVSDHVFALALSLTRGIPTFVDAKRRGEWDRSRGSELIDLEDRTATVVGLGDIGESVVRRARGFGMEVYGTKRRPEEYDSVLPTNRVLAADSLESVIGETDLLVLTVPLTEATHHLVDRSTLETLPDSALLINVARGPVVDQEALIEALENDRIAGAGLDVFDEEPLPEDSPLWEFDDVVITPHVGGRSKDFIPRFVNLFLHNYDRRGTNEPLRNHLV
jgi:D-2-hydroxyacid dehydrogenase (NADP+)